VEAFRKARASDLLLAGVPLGLASWIVHAGLGTGRYVGLPMGEVWGRLFVTGQIRRWLEGGRPMWADLVSAPGGRPFWPVDPLLQVLAIPLDAVLGEATGWAVLLGLLSWTSALGGMAAARACGAGRAGALAAGLMLQLSPFWFRYGAEGVTESLALGPPAFAAAAAIGLARAPSRAGYLRYFLAFGWVCGTSPYAAVHGALALAASLPLWPSAARRHGARLLVGTGLCGLLFLAPLAATESGLGGRLTSAWTGGYALVAEPPVASLETAPAPAAASPPSGLRQALVQWPGGFAVTGALLVGLTARRSRSVAGFALTWLALGPAWSTVARWIGAGIPSPLEGALRALPGTALLGNPYRLVAVPIVAAALVVGGLGARRRVAAGVAVAALLAAWLEVPPLCLPAVQARVPVALLPVIDGPTVTFPSGDPPIWNADAWPKAGLWLARHHGGAQAYDYGRGGVPADAALLVRMSQVAGVPAAATAVDRWGGAGDPWESVRASGFTRVLVVRRTLDASAWGRVRAWLDAEAGSPLAEEAGGAVWAVPPEP
jgi:hypothetical protein